MNGLINITRLCNLSCKYCYAGNCNLKSDSSNVDSVLLDNMDNIFMFIDQLKSLKRDKISILLHGGEPTLASPILLRKIAEYVFSKDCNATIGLQTNGTILTDELIEFYKDFNVTIGISMDGSEEINDYNRIYSSGKGSFKIIENNIRKLQNEGVAVGTLATITNRSIDNISDLYETNKRLNTSFSFNPLFIPETYVDVESIDVNGYADAICDLFDMWIEDQNTNIGIKPFERIISGFINNNVGLSVCNFSENCSFEFATIDIDGMVYPCNHLCGMEEFSYGHISKINLEEKMNNCVFGQRWKYLKDNDCADCEVYKYCFGGCPSTAHAQANTIFCKDGICSAHIKILHHVYEYLERYKKQ